VGVRLVGGELSPLIGDLVTLDALVAWAPPDLDLCVGFLGAEGGDVFPGFEGVVISAPVPARRRSFACASVKIVTDPTVWFLVAATCRGGAFGVEVWLLCEFIR